MKHLFQHIITLLILFVAILAISIISSRYMSSELGFLRLRPTVNKIVLGDSQAQCSINDKDSTVKNMAKAADSYFYSYIKLRELKKHNPEIDTVFLSLSTINITGFIENRWIRNSAHIQSRFSKYCCLFNKEDFIYLFNLNPSGVIKSFTHIPSTTLQLMFYCIKNKKGPSLLKLGGFEALNNVQLDEAIAKHKKEHENFVRSLSEVETTYLAKITDFCNKHDITLIFFNAPVHPEYLTGISEQEKHLFQQYFNKNLSQFKYLNYSEYNLPDSCFSDLVHLDSCGAELFTKIMLQDQKR